MNLSSQVKEQGMIDPMQLHMKFVLLQSELI